MRYSTPRERIPLNYQKLVTSIDQIIKKGVIFLADKGLEAARLDVEVLLSALLGVDREYLFSHGDEVLDVQTCELLFNDLTRVKEGVPVAYIIGKKEFYGLDFFVDERVLIPRPETEQIVDRVLSYVKEHRGGDRRFKLLDVGTGSGNIAVSLAKSIDPEDLEVVEAVDLSEEALEVARINAEANGVESMMHLFQSDLLEFVEEGERYDVIAANLPYIGEKKHHYVSSETEKYEPNMALFGGDDGLDLYRKMFEQLKEKRVGFELMIGEFGFAQTEDMEKILNRFFPEKFVIVKDLAGIDRIFLVSML